MNETTKTAAQKAFNLLASIGVFDDCKSVGIRHENGIWVVNGHFRNDKRGRYNGVVASFDTVEDAVDFEVMFEQLKR